MIRTSRCQVITNWLQQEMEKEHVDQPCEPRELSPADRLQRLLTITDAAVYPFVKNAHLWYRMRLTRSLLESAKLGWSAFWSTTAPVLDVARAICDPNPSPEWQRILEGIQPNMADVERKADQLPNEFDSIPVVTCRFNEPPLIVDGNHRILSVALHLLRTGELVPIDAYVGFKRYLDWMELPGRVQALWYSFRSH